ncbi:hypothetical protein VQL36_02625 [Chengkuizengella sp. SCS-71B]|uniref:hypothetical protein n=1 Tax=Chengkuizengella sp. SCS-71B TaxID=3115290 RepID=UPI0032C230EF
MSAYGRRSGSGAGIVLVLFILLVIILIAASGRSGYSENPFSGPEGEPDLGLIERRCALL